MLDILECCKIFELISESSSDLKNRNELILLRKAEISKLTPLVKVAFDTRRINQEVEYNPRRNLQYYHRGEDFISQAMSDKLKSLHKLKLVLDELKSNFGTEPEWQDSNSRILLSRLDTALRTDQKDGDHTEAQPGVGSINYIQELIYIRYRLTFENILSMSNSQLKENILSKDEELTKKSPATNITKADIGKYGYDTLVDKLFSMADSNDNVERIITISIRNKVHKED